METNRELEAFLRAIGPRAFRVARLALREDQDALDALQEAMIRMIRRYAQRPPPEWKPLFYAILRNCVRDQQRARQSRGRLLEWFASFIGAGRDEHEGAGEPSATPGPLEELLSESRLDRLQRAIALLPPRQQQAFLLRNLEDLDVRETAAAMGCSEGSVKTHYSRAVHTLRQILGEET